MTELEAIAELMDGISPGVWDWTKHNREDGKPTESVEDVVAILALSARKGTGVELHGVGAKQCGEDIVVCYTGNGPRSAANARFLANAPAAIDWLTGEVESLRARLAAVEAERGAGIDLANDMVRILTRQRVKRGRGYPVCRSCRRPASRKKNGGRDAKR